MSRTGNVRSTNVVVAAGLGALAMYLMDPQRGRRRIALARDKVGRLRRQASDTADAGLRDLTNRSTGWAARLRGVLHRAPPDDDVLVERVRAKLGRWVSHPHAIHVTAADGCLNLSGQILQAEEQRLLHGLRAIPGVRDVDNRLESHSSAGNIPSLQGGSNRPGPRSELMQENWAPGPRLLAGAGGAALALYGFGRRGLAGTLLGVAGIGLAACALSNRKIGRTMTLSRDRRGVDIEKTVHIAAPPETVFDVWSSVENFPRFMSMVEEVRRLDDTRSHWVVKGPAGARLEWDSTIVERDRPRVLAWRSEPDAPVQHAGTVHFDEENGGTKATVHMCYQPPGGALGHTVAALFGRDPKREMDEDLMRMKSFIETGVEPHDAAQARSRPNGPAASPQA